MPAKRIHHRPVNCHPLVAKTLDLIDQQQRFPRSLSLQTGYHHDTIAAWRRGRHLPKVTTLEDTLNALGYKLVIVPIDDNASSARLSAVLEHCQQLHRPE